MSQTASFTSDLQISRVTRLAIIEAGLTSKKRKAGAWSVVLAAFLIVMAGFGLVVLTLGDDPPPAQPAANDPAITATPVVSESEAARIRSTLLDGPEAEPIPLAPIVPAAEGVTPSEDARRLGQIYADLDEEKREVRPRAPAGLASPALASALPAVDTAALPAPDKHEVRPVAANPSELESVFDLQIRQVIREHHARIRSCHERQLKRDPSVQGRAVVVAVVRPSGRVARARLATVEMQGTFLEDCLVREVKRWRFPRTVGSVRELRIPLLLLAR